MAQRIRKIYVNSSHRVSDPSGSPSSFRLELPVDVQCEGVCHAAVTSVSIPHCFYGVQTGVNDKLYVRQIPANAESATNNILTIEAGNYSASSLAAKISSKLNGAALGAASYTVTYSSVSQKISITSSGVAGFLIYSESTLRGLGMIGGTAVKNPQSMNSILNTPPGSSATSWTSGVITLARLTELFIRSNLSNVSTLDSSGRYDTIKRVLVDRDFGLVITTDGSLEPSDYVDVSGRTLSSLQFSLTDSHGNLVDMHQIDWSFAINIVYGGLE